MGRIAPVHKLGPLTLVGVVLVVTASAGAARLPPTAADAILFVREDPRRAETNVNGAVDLWLVRADGTGARRVLGTPGWDESPAWAPDGRSIAFQKGIYEAGKPEDVLKSIDVWTVGADGHGARNVTHDGSAASPSWSPDGRALAYARGDGVFVVRRNGSGKRHVGRRSDPTQPAWSPDGRRITTPGELWVVRAAGTGQRRLAVGASSESPAVWTPNGRSLSFAGRGVFVVDSTGGAPRLLSRLDEEARWSPDGSRIALVRPGTPREAGIFVATSDGSRRRRLTRGLDTEPTWSPDGRRIAFRRGVLVGDIYVVGSDGSKLRNLTRTPRLDERQPAWRPR